MTAAAVAREPVELACALIPLLDEGQLLLPSVCVAEIMPWRRIKLLPDAPIWCLGLLGWRGEVVPVVRFEHLNRPHDGERRAGRCLVVMNRTAGGALPFYALAVEGLPRLVHVSEADLTELDDPPGAAEARLVRVGAETASIPSLRYVEQNVSALKPRR